MKNIKHNLLFNTITFSYESADDWTDDLYDGDNEIFSILKDRDPLIPYSININNLFYYRDITYNTFDEMKDWLYQNNIEFDNYINSLFVYMVGEEVAYFILKFGPPECD